VIVRARWLIDRNLDIHENEELTLGWGDAVHDFGDEAVLLPGLVNAHTHFDYTSLEGKLQPPTEGFTSWILKINALKKTLTTEQYRDSIQLGIDQSIAFGTTAAANWTCQPSLVPEFAGSMMRILWLKEILTVTRDEDPAEWDHFVRESAGPRKKHRPMLGLAPHAPYSCGSETRRKSWEWCLRHLTPWSAHVAESEEEFQMFNEGKGRMHDFLAALGRRMDDCGHGATPLAELFEGMTFPDDPAKLPPVSLAHANLLTATDLGLLQGMVKNGFPISVVHCPSSHEFFRHPTFPFENLERAGVNVCLGTDSLASSASLSMFEEMVRFRRAHPGVPPRQVLAMATIKAASVLVPPTAWMGWQDWIAIPITAEKADLYEAITTFTGKPRFVIVGGQEVRLAGR
jgi:aminodeoxyfutalosine deaminase